MSAQSVGILVALFLGLINLAWQGYTWRMVRREKRCALVVANMEEEPLRLIVANQGPAVARDVSVALDGVDGGISVRGTTARVKFDLDPGSQYTFFADRPAVSDVQALKVKLNWADGLGRNERLITLPIPTTKDTLWW